MSITVVQKSEEVIVVKPATYDVTISFTQEQLDWFVAFTGQIAGNFLDLPKGSDVTTPLRQVTDPLWYNLQQYTKEKVDVTLFNYVTRKESKNEFPF